VHILSSKLVIPIAAIIVGVLFWFRPGGVEGPRAEPAAMMGKTFDHSGLTTVLSKVVSPTGAVDYGALATAPADLDRYLGQLAATSPKSAPQLFRTNDDRLAYYLNAYNAFVLAAVRDHCPLNDVQSVYFGGGFFWRLSFVMGREEVTLSDLEAERIRGVMQRNPEVHLALVKGARGFPPLGQTAFEPARLQAQLQALAARTAKDPRFVSREGDVLRLSALFEWYKSDFGDTLTWIARHAPQMAKDKPAVESVPFDWALNGTCGRSPPDG
jgi:hypothetical protein